MLISGIQEVSALYVHTPILDKMPVKKEHMSDCDKRNIV